MVPTGFGDGYEMNTLTEDVGDGKRRMAAIIFWRGSGAFGPMVPSARNAIATGEKAPLPIRLLLYPLLPIAWAFDKVSSLRRKRRRSKAAKPAPMSPAVRAAQASARYEAGVLTVGSQTLTPPSHATLVVFVEDDPSAENGVSIKTHRIATDAYSPKPPMDPVDIARIRATRDPEVMREIAMKRMPDPRKGEGWVLHTIHADPVCREFMERVGAR